MINSLSLEKILTLENDDNLLAFFCDEAEIPAWSLIRVAFFRSIMTELLFTSGSLMSQSRSHEYLKAVEYLAKASMHNLLHKNDYSSEICFFSTGLGNYSSSGKTKDRLVSYFADCYPSSTLIYQEQADWAWHKEYYFDRILYAAPINVLSQFLGRVQVRSRHRELANAVINLAARNAKARIGYSFNLKSLEALKSSLSKQLAIFPYISEFYTNWFAKRGFKLLFKEDACYGARSVSVLYAAKQAGLVTAEFQHGAISKGHDGYNVAETLKGSIEFQRSLPDYLLTYGNWWSMQSNMPTKKIAIGNPHLTESIKAYKKLEEKCERILILGDGIETKLYLELASKIAKLFRGKNARIVFRPHPFERNEIKSMSLPDSVLIDSHADIYPSLFESSVVISELSTGLFEAVGLVDTVLMWETDKSRFAFPEIPFQSFSSIDQLERMLLNPSLSLINVEPHDLWQLDWRANFMKFVDKVLQDG